MQRRRDLAPANASLMSTASKFSDDTADMSMRRNLDLDDVAAANSVGKIVSLEMDVAALREEVVSLRRALERHAEDVSAAAGIASKDVQELKRNGRVFEAEAQEAMSQHFAELKQWCAEHVTASWNAVRKEVISHKQTTADILTNQVAQRSDLVVLEGKINALAAAQVDKLTKMERENMLERECSSNDIAEIHKSLRAIVDEMGASKARWEEGLLALTNQFAGVLEEQEKMVVGQEHRIADIEEKCEQLVYLSSTQQQQHLQQQPVQTRRSQSPLLPPRSAGGGGEGGGVRNDAPSGDASRQVRQERKRTSATRRDGDDEDDASENNSDESDSDIRKWQRKKTSDRGEDADGGVHVDGDKSLEEFELALQTIKLGALSHGKQSESILLILDIGEQLIRVWKDFSRSMRVKHARLERSMDEVSSSSYQQYGRTKKSLSRVRSELHAQQRERQVLLESVADCQTEMSQLKIKVSNSAHTKDQIEVMEQLQHLRQSLARLQSETENGLQTVDASVRHSSRAADLRIGELQQQISNLRRAAAAQDTNFPTSPIAATFTPNVLLSSSLRNNKSNNTATGQAIASVASSSSSSRPAPAHHDGSRRGGSADRSQGGNTRDNMHDRAAGRQHSSSNHVTSTNTGARRDISGQLVDAEKWASVIDSSYVI